MTQWQDGFPASASSNFPCAAAKPRFSKEEFEVFHLCRVGFFPPRQLDVLSMACCSMWTFLPPWRHWQEPRFHQLTAWMCGMWLHMERSHLVRKCLSTLILKIVVRRMA